MEIKIKNLEDQKNLPEEITCDGENLIPEIELSGISETTESLALIMDDPDAQSVIGRTFDHWLIWNIPPETTSISNESLPSDAVQGKNDFGKNSYGGPCPPKGHGPHEYLFKVYALDTKLDLPEGSTKQELEEAMKEHIIEKAETSGIYER